MVKRFDDIEVGEQLELTVGAGCVVYGAGKDYDPNRIVSVAIVTDIWFDPVDNKEYVGLAKLRPDGAYGKPTEKRTITGLARTGWRRTQKDWITHLRAVADADRNKVTFFRRKP